MNAIERRSFLQALAGLGLSFAMPALEPRAAERRGPARQKSLITLWMSGGPSQLETWDPHPGTEIGGPTKAIKTPTRGLEIAEHFPRVAEQIDALSVVRSLVSKEGDHERGTYMMKTGFRPETTLVHPSLGSILVHEAPNPQLEIPQHVSLGESQWPSRGGYFGAQYDAFKVFDPGRGLHNMQAPVESDRQATRLKNLDVVSKTFQQGRRLQSERTLHQHTLEAALKMMRSDQLVAFDLKDEAKATLAAYGDTNFGRGCLVARRLIEKGVRAVEVTLNGFDTHGNNFEGHKTQAAILDPAFSALLIDLKERQLLDSTVVLCVGEFGRTPKINPLDGRDHWPTGFSCVIGGGGLRGGLVLGETDPTGQKTEPTQPIPVQNLFATVLKTLGVDFKKELITPIGRPMILSQGQPIAELLTM